MVNIPRISFKDLLRYNEEVIHDFEDNILVANALKSDLYLTKVFPIRTSFFMFVLIEEGNMQIELDYALHDLARRDFLLILPEHILQWIDASDETRYKFIFIEQEYFKSMNMGKNDVFKFGFLSIRKAPVLRLSEDEFEIISSCHERIKQRIEASHNLKRDIINTLLMEYVIETENIIIGHNQRYIKESSISRQDVVFHDFLENLKENVVMEHDVRFYSDKLNITPQYLASILKQVSGKGTKDWISNSLLIEAKIMLKHSQQSIQQISDALNFYDQSAFGKFFKAHTGQTPKEYQKQ